MIEADSKAIWNLPFFVPLPESSHFSSTFIYLIIVIFIYPSGYFFHKSCGGHK